MSMRELAAAGKFWSLNGVAATDMRNMSPLLTLRKGASHTIALRNKTRWPHPVHLHGHSFSLRDPRYFDGDEVVVRDTALLAPEEEVEIHFVANNLGAWMLHCHILEHQEAGMMAIVEVL